VIRERYVELQIPECIILLIYFMDEELQKSLKRRAQITAMILGASAIISIFFLLFAVTQRQLAEKFQRENEVLKKENESFRNKLK
jgi:Na+/melibiose symporter-like transporter